MNIVRCEQDGVEFFTVEATGESGMSQSGLAVLCGVSKSTIGRLLAKMMNSELLQSEGSESLKGFIDNSFYLLYNFEKNGGSVKILRSAVCAAIIQHYAFAGKKEAQAAWMKFTSSGIDTWVQGITGWKNNYQQSSSQPTVQANPEKALPASWMSADLAPEDKEYQRLKALAQQELANLGHRFN